MTKYTSQYKSLAFYVNDELQTFSNGEYNATTKAQEDALENVASAVKVAEAKAPAKKAAPKTKEA